MQENKPAMRAPLHQRFQYFFWRWLKNGGDSWRHVRASQRLDSFSREVVSELRAEGIVCASDVSTPELLSELRAESSKILEQAWDESRQRPREGVVDGKGDRSLMEARENKDFLVVLTPKFFSPDSIFLRYALQSRFIRIADAYLGLNAQLRSIQLWLNFATEGEASSTQLWHRDGDDFMNLKVFTYLSDVDEQHGPFSFVPGTQPLGYRQLIPSQSNYGRTDDAKMEALVDRQQWRICTGPAGSTIFADTCGYHKGLKPVKGCRLMLMAHYTSRAAVSRNDVRLMGDPDRVLTPEQRAALR